MDLNLYVVTNCPACERAHSKISSFVETRRNLNLKITNIQTTAESFVTIVPALYVNETLFSYGDFDDDQLDVFIKNLNLN